MRPFKLYREHRRYPNRVGSGLFWHEKDSTCRECTQRKNVCTFRAEPNGKQTGVRAVPLLPPVQNRFYYEITRPHCAARSSPPLLSG